MTLLCRVVGILHGCIKTASNYDEDTAWAARERRRPVRLCLTTTHHRMSIGTRPTGPVTARRFHSRQSTDQRQGIDTNASARDRERVRATTALVGGLLWPMGRAADADVLLATTVAEVVARQVTEPELSCLPAVVSDEARELPLQFDVPEFEASPDRPQYSAPVCIVEE
jgi:hypothetical protein